MRTWLWITPLMLAGCTGTLPPQPLTPKQEAALDKALAGKVAGEKMSCVNREPQTNLTVISNNVLLYRVSKKLVYKNELIGSCNGLTRDDIIITQSWGSQMCRGDLTRTADRMSGMLSGACALGDFVPYRTPTR